MFKGLGFFVTERNFILYLLLQEDLENGEEVATCPSCSLIVKVIYDQVSETVLYVWCNIQVSKLMQHELDLAYYPTSAMFSHTVFV